MKSFFQRKNDSQTASSKSAAVKDPYKIWMPRQESNSAQKPLERTERREGRSSARDVSQKPRSSSRAPRPTDATTTTSAAHRSHRHAPATNTIVTNKEDTAKNTVNPSPITPTPASMQSQRVAQTYTNSKPTVPVPNPTFMTASYNPPPVQAVNVAKTYAGSTYNGTYPTASTSASAAAIRPEMATASSSYSRRERESSDRHGERPRDRSERDRVREREPDRPKERERTRDRVERDRGMERERDRTKERDRERERDRDREQRVRERERDKDRDRDKYRDRDRDRDRDRERERGREGDRDRDRARDRTKLRAEPLPYAEPIPIPDRAHRERNRQRDTDSIFRASGRDKERSRHRERDIPRVDERTATYDSGREKSALKDSNQYRETSRRPDWDQERLIDAGRSSRPRKAEREQDSVRNFAVPPKLAGKESSDEAESSDASKYKYASAHRRTRANDTVPISTSALPASAAQSYMPPSKDPPTYSGFAAPSVNHDPTSYGHPTSSSVKANQDPPRYIPALAASKPNQESVSYAGPTITPASKHIPDSKSNQPLFSPEPLPIRLPTRITESALFREPPPPPLDNTVSTSNEMKRSEKYNTSTTRSQDKVQDVTSNVPLNQQRGAEGQSMRPAAVSSSVGIPPATEASVFVPSGTQGLGYSGQNASTYPMKAQVSETVYPDPQATRASSSRHEHTSHRHRHTEQANNGEPVLNSTRTRKVSTSSQQAVPVASTTAPSATTVIPPSIATTTSRRERDKGSKRHETPYIREPRVQHDMNPVHDPLPQNAENPASLLFQGSQTANPSIPPAATVNNSPHPSIRFTPPTPMQRSPSVLEERPVVNTNFLSTLNMPTPRSQTEAAKAVSKEHEHTPPSMQNVQPTKEVVANYNPNPPTPQSFGVVLQSSTKTHEVCTLLCGVHVCLSILNEVYSSFDTDSATSTRTFKGFDKNQ
ncbi:hypothetical protein FB446DRAFT_7864 [Lentinula raphanica]|nr:hypothetical protein FB446DRAFT_7864 [Lentinula raphanica]